MILNREVVLSQTDLDFLAQKYGVTVPQRRPVQPPTAPIKSPQQAIQEALTTHAEALKRLAQR